MKKTILEELLFLALEKLLDKDSYLLEHDVNERSITHKLAKYLEDFSKEIPGFEWNIDVEYNRNYDEPKRLGLDIENIPNTDTEAKSVFPDIIIHKRGKNNSKDFRNNNILIIEIKKDAQRKQAEKDKDIRKIKAFLKQEPYSYKFGMFINLNTGNNPKYEIEWIEIN